MLRICAAMLLLGLISSPRAIFVESAATNTSLTAEFLAGILVGENITFTNSSFGLSTTYTPDSRGIGQYSNGVIEAQGNQMLGQGIVLGTGKIESLNTIVNSTDYVSSTLISSGDADLTALLPLGSITKNATILEFDFFTIGEGTMDVSFQYLFGSDEYEEYVGTRYNDVFGFFVDGNNLATVPGTTTPITINTINPSNNSELYNSNDPTNGVPTPFNTEMDGFTVPLTAEFTVAGGSPHHLKIAIADGEDFRWDSWVFIGAGSFSAHSATSVPEPNLGYLLGVGFLFLTGIQLISRKKAV